MLALSNARSSNAAQAAGMPQARARLAAGHAIEGWRLGGVRRRQQLGISEPRSFCRSQRHARPHVSGYYGARARIALRARLEQGSSVGARAASTTWCAISGPMEAGMAAGASRTFTARVSRCAVLPRPARATAKRTCCAAANGCAPFRMPMAAGARAAPATTTNSSLPPRARHRRRPGRFWPDRRRRSIEPERAAWHRVPARDAAQRWKLG